MLVFRLSLARRNMIRHAHDDRMLTLICFLRLSLICEFPAKAAFEQTRRRRFIPFSLFLYWQSKALKYT